MSTSQKTCFIIMPFSDMEGYESGHFGRVYEHLIRPACVAAGVEPVRGDEVKGTNYIAIDILQRILKSDIVICDLSGKNANVMYELGIRQAFDLPVVLLKDKKTERVFDIQGLRTLDYVESLRIDSVEQDRESLAETISATLKREDHEVNSLVSLLGIQKATLGSPTEVSGETALILASLKDISARLATVEEVGIRRASVPSMVRLMAQNRKAEKDKVVMPGGGTLTVGEEVYDLSSRNHSAIGLLVAVNRDGLTIQPKVGGPFIIPPDDPRFDKLNDLPF
jgi:hypothetical protein